MNSKPEGVGARACWFVGATYGGTDDQTPRFLQEGIWENGYQDKYLDAVKSIQAVGLLAHQAAEGGRRQLGGDLLQRLLAQLQLALEQPVGMVGQFMEQHRFLRAGQADLLALRAVVAVVTVIARRAFITATASIAMLHPRFQRISHQLQNCQE